MEKIKVLLYTTDNTFETNIKSALEILKAEIKNDYQFEIIVLDNVKNLEKIILKHNFNVVFIHHKDNDTNGFTFIDKLKNIDIQKNININIPEILIFFGDNDTEAAIKALKEEKVKDYIITINFRYEKLPDLIIQHLSDNKTVNEKKEKNKEKFLEIIRFQDTLVDDLIERIINISNKASKPDENNKDDLDDIKVKRDVLDIRLYLNDKIKEQYLKFEIEILIKIVKQFINSYLEKYKIKKILNEKEKMLIAFNDNNAVKCALEIVIKLAQINFSGNSVLNNFKFFLGIDRARAYHIKSPKDVKGEITFKHMDVLFENSTYNNTLYISDVVFFNLKDKVKEYFNIYKKEDKFNIYKFNVKYG